MELNDLLISLSLILIIYFIFRKFNFLIDDVSYSDHKKIGILNNSPIILGGVYLTASIILLAPDNYNHLKIFCFFILILGLLSDRNYLPNPSIRLLLQILILFFFIYNQNLQINSISIDSFDKFLAVKMFNIIFTLFCFAILMNGSNFLDGLNGLLSGYYILVLISLIFIGNFSNDVQLNNLDLIFVILKILLIFFVFNIFGVVYLGDGGSYIISILIGFLLVSENQINMFISPYYVVMLLWYPAFENLFSLTRRLYNKDSVSTADKLHLHQLIFRYLRLKKTISEKNINTFSSLIILVFNIPIFVIASLNYSNTKILSSVIIVYVTIYLSVYFYLLKKIVLKKNN